MGVLTDFYAFDTARFEALRKGRRIRALASALVSEPATPPIAVEEHLSIDKVQLDHFALLLDASMRPQLDAENLSPRFFLRGARPIAHPQVDVGYWDPFYAVEVFDEFDELCDRHMKSAKRKVIRRVGGALIKQPDDPFRTEVWAYKKADLATVLGVVRAVMERAQLPSEAIRPVSTEIVIDAFFDVIRLLHRAFEPLTPAGRRGKPWTIVFVTR